MLAPRVPGFLAVASSTGALRAPSFVPAALEPEPVSAEEPIEPEPAPPTTETIDFEPEENEDGTRTFTPRGIPIPDVETVAPEPVSQVDVEKTQLAIEALKRQSEKLAEQARSDALAIGLEIARHLVQAELTQSVEPLLVFAKEAVQALGAERKVEIRMHPDDVQLFRLEGLDTELPSLSAAQVELIADEKLCRGDCEIESEAGLVDGRLDARLKELAQTLRSTSS